MEDNIMYKVDVIKLNKNTCRNLCFRIHQAGNDNIRLYYIDSNFTVHTKTITSNNIEDACKYRYVNDLKWKLLGLLDFDYYVHKCKGTLCSVRYDDTMYLFIYDENDNLHQIHNKMLIKIFFAKLDIKDNIIDDLPRLTKLCKIYSHKNDKPLTDIERTKVMQPRFIRSKPNTFDYVYVDIALTTDTANIEFVKKYKKELDKMVLDKLHSYNPFTRYHIPDNFLRIERITLTRDNLLEYVIGLKMNDFWNN